MSRDTAHSAAGSEQTGLAFGEGPYGLGIGVVKGEVWESDNEGSGDKMRDKVGVVIPGKEVLTAGTATTCLGVFWRLA